MTQMFSHFILRILASKIKANGMFAVMVDGTQDICGSEQESVCIRHVDSELCVHEDFLGLYKMQQTTGDAIARMILDVLTRFSLSAGQIRAQTYDGASNMSGKYNGCQAVISSQYPLATYFHCQSHLANLVMQESITSCPFFRDAVQWVHELGVLFKRSGKFKVVFESVVACSTELINTKASIRPLCPTRWLCRLSAILSVLENYSAVTESLRSMSEGSTDSATKANALLNRFEKTETFLALYLVKKPIALLEQLNSSMQASSSNLSGSIEAVATTAKQIQVFRDPIMYTNLFDETTKISANLGLDEISVPRRRQPTPRFAGSSPHFHAKCAKDHYRLLYVEFIDCLLGCLQKRYDVRNSSFQTYLEIENMIMKGTATNLDLISKYPELNVTQLSVQLPMFKQHTGASSVNEAKLAYRAMSSELRQLFTQVFILLKLLLVCPVSSCECERSFSTLRRLKTWLRSTTIPRFA
uniref:Zinc finger MYM-type protein 1-like n=1 Tax=Phallusia mammillata TaxID=59560 RepID=A0A6F9DWX9_9ASCI|nr:zinc finger MYM-type protein 1-like [Phallusia mammillata]